VIIFQRRGPHVLKCGCSSPAPLKKTEEGLSFVATKSSPRWRWGKESVFRAGARQRGFPGLAEAIYWLSKVVFLRLLHNEPTGHKES
jgi:hypothetical protein